MHEADSIFLQFPCQLIEISLYYVSFHMYQRVEAEHKIERLVGNKVQRSAVIQVVFNVGTRLESLLASLDAFLRHVDNDQALTKVFEELGPSPKTGGDFQNSSSWDISVNTR
jgi:hypothetical protein